MRQILSRGCLTAVLLWTAALILPANAALFEVTEIQGSRELPMGTTRNYGLYIPIPAAGQPLPPYPAVVIHHGLFSSQQWFANHCTYLAKRGIIAVTVDVHDWTDWADSTRALADWVKWFVRENTTAGSPLEGLVDVDRLGVAGHSLGGLLAFNATHQLQNNAHPIRATCLLDAVPDASSNELAPTLKPIPFAVFTAEKTDCNSAHAPLYELMSLMTFPTEDVKVVGAAHCDCESPVDTTLCSPFCGGHNDAQEGYFKRLLYLFFQDALAVPSVEGNPETYEEKLALYLSQGKVIITPYGPPPPTPTEEPTITPTGLPTDTPSPTPEITATPTPTPISGRANGDFNNSGCTDIDDFLFLLDNWQTVSIIGPPEIGLDDFLSLLDFWQTGPNC